MTAENVYNIAIHLPEKEIQKLLDMLDKKTTTFSIPKQKKSKRFTDRQAIDYLLANVFCKKQ